MLNTRYLTEFRFEWHTAPRWKLWILTTVSGAAITLCTAYTLDIQSAGKSTKDIIPAALGMASGLLCSFSAHKLRKDLPRYMTRDLVEKETMIIEEQSKLPIAPWEEDDDDDYSLPQPQKMPVKSDWEQNQTTNESLELFDWGRFNTERDDFPHIAIAGKTGGGKSYLAEFLATLFEGYTIAVSPHWKKGDFTSAYLVVGWGRNTGESAQFEYSFADIMTGQFNVSVGGFMYALLQEMDRRYQLNPITQEYIGVDDPEVVVILDEFNLYANLEGLPIITKQLLREARKVRIRLIPLVQGTEVKAMGVEGEGQLREQLTFIRVKNKAKEYADQEFSKHCRDEKARYWEMVKNFISGSRYSCFVDNEPAQIPDLAEWKKLQPTLANLAGFACTPEPPVCKPDSFADEGCTDAQGDNLSTEVCPSCGSEDVRTNGKTSSGAIRYRCKSCDKTWSTSVGDLGRLTHQPQPREADIPIDFIQAPHPKLR